MVGMEMLEAIFREQLGWNAARINFLASFIMALLRVRTVNLAEIPGNGGIPVIAYNPRNENLSEDALTGRGWADENHRKQLPDPVPFLFLPFFPAPEAGDPRNRGNGTGIIFPGHGRHFHHPRKGL